MSLPSSCTCFMNKKRKNMFFNGCLAVICWRKWITKTGANLEATFEQLVYFSNNALLILQHLKQNWKVLKKHENHKLLTFLVTNSKLKQFLKAKLHICIFYQNFIAQKIIKATLLNFSTHFKATLWMLAIFKAKLYFCCNI